MAKGDFIREQMKNQSSTENNPYDIKSTSESYRKKFKRYSDDPAYVYEKDIKKFQESIVAPRRGVAKLHGSGEFNPCDLRQGYKVVK